MNDFLVHLRSSPEFRQIMADIAKHRPTLPAYTPAEDGEWMIRARFELGRQAGWDLLWNHILGKQN